MNRRVTLALAGLSVLLLANACPPGPDWLVAGDPVDPTTGLIYEIVPGAPRVTAAPDGPASDVANAEATSAEVDDQDTDAAEDDDRDTDAAEDDDQDTDAAEDDDEDTDGVVIGPEIGDIDLVIRSMAATASAIPPPAALRAGGDVPLIFAHRASPGGGVAFTVFGSTGTLPLEPPPDGTAFPGHPVLALAFADLDGDGYIGITLLDGDPLDAGIEETELVPIARRYALVGTSTASGELFVPLGGPPGAELDIALAAVTYAGPRLPGYYGGGVPMGPAIMTRLPFPPQTAPSFVLGTQPSTANANALVGANIVHLIEPDPSNPAIGESFTLRLDGSQPSIDTARVQSRDFVRFAFGRRPDILTYNDMPSRPLRPGLGDAGERVVYEMIHHLTLPDDGSGETSTLRVLPIDHLGNIAALPQPHTVEIVASGALQIVWPNTDGDPTRETLVITDSRGAEIVVDDLGGAGDDANTAQLGVTGACPPNLLEVAVVDPDVDDSGLVDQGDLVAIENAMDSEVGDPEFQRTLDLDGSGRVRESDLAIVTQALGQSVAAP
ncbi:MAG: dockerin type I domain-containing protein [Myxococcota bacterium]|nr:dockerin type I domain-containing protein [Myxococcota bacterium]